MFNKNYNNNNNLTLLRFFGRSTLSSQVSPREQQWRNRMPLAQVLAEDAFWLFSSRIRAWTGIRWWRQVPWGRPPDGEVLTQQPLVPSGDRAPFGTARGAVTAARVCFHRMTACFFYLRLNGEYFKSCLDWLITLIEKQQLPQGLLKQCDPLQFAGKRVLLTFSNSVSQDTQSDNIFCSIIDWRGGTLCDYATWRHN